MGIVGQIEGGAEVIDAATRHSWEAGAVAVILLVMLGGIGWLMRALWNVNTRLAERVTKLETILSDRLIAIVEDTTKAVSANTQMMERTANAIDRLEAAVEASLHTQDVILARIETSPCLMSTALSKETQDRLTQARDAAIKASKDQNK